jgi:hypothetical protein
MSVPLILLICLSVAMGLYPRAVIDLLRPVISGALPLI